MKKNSSYGNHYVKIYVTQNCLEKLSYFLILSNDALYKSSILFGHFDTNIVDFQLFWKKLSFFDENTVWKGGVITNREGVNKNFSKFWKDKGPKLNHEKDELKRIYLRDWK